MDKGRRHKRHVALNKREIETKLTSFQKALDEIKAMNDERVGAEVDERAQLATELERRKTEILEDAETRKRGFLTDLDVYEDDVTFEVDRVMETVDDLGSELDKARSKLDDLLESKSSPCLRNSHQLIPVPIQGSKIWMMMPKSVSKHRSRQWRLPPRLQSRKYTRYVTHQ